MPVIKPFKAFKPSLSRIEKIVTRPVEYFKPEEVRNISEQNPINFLNLIDPALTNPYQRGSYSALVYKTIEENLDTFRENDVLVAEHKPSIYIYEIDHDGLKQRGIWTLTHINDYLNGKIKKHEHTVEIREVLLAEYISQTGLDANPVLITYKKDETVDGLIKKTVEKKADVDFEYADGSKHRVWIINSEADVKKLVKAFAQMPEVYIADGHHRAASMAKMSLQKRNLYYNDEDAGFNYFSTVYMDTEEVKVLPYYRLVKDLAGMSEDQFLAELGKNFTVEKASERFIPEVLHQFGMCLSSGWYTLTAKPHTYDENPVDVLDVSVLQNFVLEPLLHIENPRNDARIAFEGGKTGLEALEKCVTEGDFAVAFTLNAITPDQIIAVADAQSVMPPKSTWIEPKFLVGLLTNIIAR